MDNKDAVRRFILGNFFVPQGSVLADDDPLLEHGIIDSTGVLDIIGFIEQSYSIQMDDEEIVPENLGSISKIAGFVERKGGVLRGDTRAVH